MDYPRNEEAVARNILTKLEGLPKTATFNPNWQRFGQVLRDYDIQENIESWCFIKDMTTGDTLLIEAENRTAQDEKDSGLPLYTISCWNGRDPREIWTRFLNTSELTQYLKQKYRDDIKE